MAGARPVVMLSSCVAGEEAALQESLPSILQVGHGARPVIPALEFKALLSYIVQY